MQWQEWKWAKKLADKSIGKNRIFSSPNMVDLGGYVIILVETQDKKVKLYGKNLYICFQGQDSAKIYEIAQDSAR